VFFFPSTLVHGWKPAFPGFSPVSHSFPWNIREDYGFAYVHGMREEAGGVPVIKKDPVVL
jgi:hypothetical protein